MKRIIAAAAVAVALGVWGCDDNPEDPCAGGVCVDHSIIATFHQECSGCHQWQRVFSVSFSSVDEAWSLVDHMVDNGANLAQEDVMALAEYLHELRCGDG